MLLLKFLQCLPPETAHALALWVLSHDMVKVSKQDDNAKLGINLWGHYFKNPIGLAAGFDKNARAFKNLLKLGFGFVEVGTVTPRPQSGNISPRLFRLPEDQAIINRMGFNNDGLVSVSQRLQKFNSFWGFIGGNIGMNKDTTDPIQDYLMGIEKLSPLVNYLVINISSPNTPGLREWQKYELFQNLIQCCVVKKKELSSSIPLLVKISPDLTLEEINILCDLCMNLGIDGLIVSNTTITRPNSLMNSKKNEAGGLSGRPIFQLSTDCLFQVYKCTKGMLPLIGVGGVSNGAEAYQKIKAGASLIQLYTSFIYGGISIIQKIKDELLDELKKDGFTSIKDAIGTAHK
ncbi:MAG: quinone-dependent dihydroorotate dehydrogenase [Alphaproteobacteria bacterium]|nr:quinone-dependent dihydroorotate dehydrogenase [Alphaproteobacteria bacterium]